MRKKETLRQITPLLWCLMAACKPTDGEHPWPPLNLCIPLNSSCTAFIYLILIADWLHNQIPSELGGVEGEKCALSHWTIPLFQLPWSGMPDFTARYPPPGVNQNFARVPVPSGTAPTGPLHSYKSAPEPPKTYSNSTVITIGENSHNFEFKLAIHFWVF